VFLRWWAALPADARSGAVISRADLQEFVVHLRQRGVKPVSCNCYLRAVNAFCRWLHQEGYNPQSVRLPPLKLEKRLLVLHDERTLRLILSYRPHTFVPWRVYAVACTILDSGCRIDELLTARVEDFDFDNLSSRSWGRVGSSARCRSPLSFAKCCFDSRR
jgi:integrase